MRHVLAPTGEDPAGKGVLEGDQVMGVAGTVIESVLEFLNDAMQNRFKRYEAFYLDKTGWLIIVFPVKCHEMDPMKIHSP